MKSMICAVCKDVKECSLADGAVQAPFFFASRVKGIRLVYGNANFFPYRILGADDVKLYFW